MGILIGDCIYVSFYARKRMGSYNNISNENDKKKKESERKGKTCRVREDGTTPIKLATKVVFIQPSSSSI